MKDMKDSMLSILKNAHGKCIDLQVVKYTTLGFLN